MRYGEMGIRAGAEVIIFCIGAGLNTAITIKMQK